MSKVEVAKGTVGVRAQRQGRAWWVRGGSGARVRSLVFPQSEVETAGFGSEGHVI